MTQLLKRHNETSAKENKGNIHFVRPGESVTTAKKKPRQSWLSGANDWQWLFDYDHQQYVLEILIWSDSLKKIIMIELTCPAEENGLKARQLKEQKYI